MTRIQQHLIHRETLKVTTDSSDGLALQKKISYLLSNQILQGMSELFDNLVNVDEWLILEKLDIQLGSILEDEIDTNLAGRLLEKIRMEIENRRDQIQSQSVTGESPAEAMLSGEKVIRAFLFFLGKGILPWWYEVSSHSDFEDEIVSAFEDFHTSTLNRSPEYYRDEFKKILETQPAAIRLTGQFGEMVLNAVLDFLFQQYCDLIKKYFGSVLEGLTGNTDARSGQKYDLVKTAEIKAQLLRLVVGGFKNQATLSEEWLSVLASSVRRYQKSLTESKEFNDNPPLNAVDEMGNEAERPEDLKRDIESIEGVMIKNAGLVIVAPFLPELFAECGILKNNSIVDMNKAMDILHYIVWNTSDYREYDIILNKVICDAVESFHFMLKDGLAAEDKVKVDEMLQSVIFHWKTLKNTSVEGLRESFLQRSGKLSFKYDNWVLQVEQNTIDILLQSLPWTIGIIKLPWMKTMLKTEWI